MLFSFLCVFGYALFVILLGVVSKKLGLKKTYSRKIVHILVGGEWILLYFFFGTSIESLAVCLIFTLLNLLSYVFHWFDQSMGSDSDNAPGTVYYAVSMSVMAFICLFFPEGFIPFGIAVAMTSLGDGLAGVVGTTLRRKNPKLCGEKTLFGTLSCFVVCLCSAIAFDFVFDLHFGIPFLLFLAVFAAEIELCSMAGRDNLWVPLFTFFLAILKMYAQPVIDLIPACLIVPLVFIVAKEKNKLTYPALIFSVLEALFITLSFGNAGFLCLLCFFVFGTLSDLPKKKKMKLLSIEEKTGKRDAYQVLANGGVASILAIANLLYPHPIFSLSMVASVAEALADTSASGIGSLSDHAFDPFRMKKVTPGTSGGVSFTGFGGALLGAVIISAVGCVLLPASILNFYLLTVIGFSGCVFDSFLGSVFQRKFLCQKCNAVTEKRMHCGEKTTLISGISFIGNDLVNFLSCAFSSLLVFLVFS